MPKFRLNRPQGGPNSVPVAPHSHSDGHWYAPGEVLESESDLAAMFPGKFSRVSDSAKATAKEGPAKTASTEHLGVKVVQDNDSFKPPKKIEKGDENKGIETVADPADEVEEGEEGVDVPAKEDEGDEEAKPAKTKAPAKAKAKQDNGDAAKAKPKKGTDGDEDVTDKFEAAGAAELTVVKNKDGYVVKDGSRVLSKEPLADAKKVKAFLKEHAGEDAE